MPFVESTLIEMASPGFDASGNCITCLHIIVVVRVLVSCLSVTLVPLIFGVIRYAEALVHSVDIGQEKSFRLSL